MLSGLTSEIIDAGAVGGNNEYNYIISGGEFDIIGVDTVADTFTIDDDYQSYFPVGTQFIVEDSTGNDGIYTVQSVTLTAGDTVITVDEDITDATADGILYIDHLPIAKALSGGSSDAYHWPLEITEYTPGMVAVQTLKDTTGQGSLTQTLGGATGTGTLNYKSGALHAEFENDVAAGNSVVVEFKYHDVPKAPVASKTVLEADDPAIDISGEDFFSYEKLFDGTDASTKIVFQGAGTGKLKCYIYLHQYEGIDDGKSWGGTPFYFEGGLFDGDGDLLMYFTFIKERKTGSTTISHIVDVYM